MNEIDLKGILIKNGCTQASFYSKSGVSLATISKICNDIGYNPSPLMKNKIRKALILLGFIKESDWVMVNNLFQNDLNNEVVEKNNERN